MADPGGQEKRDTADYPDQQKLMVGRSKIGQVSETGEVVRALHLLVR